MAEAALEVEVIKAVRAPVPALLVRRVLQGAASIPEVAARLPAGTATVAVRLTGDRELRRPEGVAAGKTSGETLKSCAMIITAPNSFVAEVHDRMPVLLAERDFDPWLSGGAGLELLMPAADDALQRWPVSKRVNSSKAPADDPIDLHRLGFVVDGFYLIHPRS